MKLVLFVFTAIVCRTQSIGHGYGQRQPQRQPPPQQQQPPQPQKPRYPGGQAGPGGVAIPVGQAGHGYQNGYPMDVPVSQAMPQNWPTKENEEEMEGWPQKPQPPQQPPQSQQADSNPESICRCI